MEFAAAAALVVCILYKLVDPLGWTSYYRLGKRIRFDGPERINVLRVKKDSDVLEIDSYIRNLGRTLAAPEWLERLEKEQPRELASLRRWFDGEIRIVARDASGQGWALDMIAGGWRIAKIPQGKLQGPCLALVIDLAFGSQKDLRLTRPSGRATDRVHSLL
ncbi:MAG: hypothetical protein KGI79_01525 [Patescibacteria group bacterium]|nr:hypothetical protein [Patescibacteria group bacterium]